MNKITKIAVLCLFCISLNGMNSTNQSYFERFKSNIARLRQTAGPIINRASRSGRTAAVAVGGATLYQAASNAKQWYDDYTSPANQQLREAEKQIKAIEKQNLDNQKLLQMKKVEKGLLAQQALLETSIKKQEDKIQGTKTKTLSRMQEIEQATKLSKELKKHDEIQKAVKIQRDLELQQIQSSYNFWQKLGGWFGK